jgi:hypothetical protein
MTYDTTKHRYTLTEEYVRENGVDLSLTLNTEHMPEPSKAPKLFLEHISFLVYTNIYSYGRQKGIKEYLLACNTDNRPVIRDAMMERIRYIYDSGDLSSKSGVIIENGTRVERYDLIASPQEEQILRTVGLLHRGGYYIEQDNTLTY